MKTVHNAPFMMYSLFLSICLSDIALFSITMLPGKLKIREFDKISCGIYVAPLMIIFHILVDSSFSMKFHLNYPFIEIFTSLSPCTSHPQHTKYLKLTNKLF